MLRVYVTHAREEAKTSPDTDRFPDRVAALVSGGWFRPLMIWVGCTLTATAMPARREPHSPERSFYRAVNLCSHTQERSFASGNEAGRLRPKWPSTVTEARQTGHHLPANSAATVSMPLSLLSTRPSDEPHRAPCSLLSARLHHVCRDRVRDQGGYTAHLLQALLHGAPPFCCYRWVLERDRGPAPPRRCFLDHARSQIMRAARVTVPR